jgi:hypothetical protein
MINGPALGVILAVALGYFAVAGVVDGAKHVAHGVKKAGHAVVHVLKHAH